MSPIHYQNHNDRHLEEGLRDEKAILQEQTAHQTPASPPPPPSRKMNLRRITCTLSAGLLLGFGLVTASKSRLNGATLCPEQIHATSHQELKSLIAQTRDDASALSDILRCASPETFHKLVSVYFPDRTQPQAEKARSAAIGKEDEPWMISAWEKLVVKRQDDGTGEGAATPSSDSSTAIDGEETVTEPATVTEVVDPATSEPAGDVSTDPVGDTSSVAETDPVASTSAAEVVPGDSSSTDAVVDPATSSTSDPVVDPVTTTEAVVDPIQSTSSTEEVVVPATTTTTSVAEPVTSASSTSTTEAAVPDSSTVVAETSSTSSSPTEEQTSTTTSASSTVTEKGTSTSLEESTSTSPSSSSTSEPISSSSSSISSSVPLSSTETTSSSAPLTTTSTTTSTSSSSSEKKTSETTSDPVGVHTGPGGTTIHVTSKPVQKTLTSTLADGRTTTLTSTSWVAVDPPKKTDSESDESDASLQDAGLSLRASVGPVVAIGGFVVGMLMI